MSDRNMVYNYKTDEWEKIPKIAPIGKVVFERPITITDVQPSRKRGVMIGKIETERRSYTRRGMAMVKAKPADKNDRSYEDIIRSLKNVDYELWKIIKDAVNGEGITIKLNNTIVMKLLGMENASSASRVIKRLVDSGLIIKADKYKDLYGVNPDIYFRGNYNSFAIDYINSGYNKRRKSEMIEGMTDNFGAATVDFPLEEIPEEYNY